MAIKHQDVLRLLAADGLVEAIDHDVRYCALMARLPPEAASLQPAQIGADVIDAVLLRWNCALQADPSDVPPLYVHKAALALAVCLHRQGFGDTQPTAAAVAAVEALNAAVALSDAFYRRSPEIIALLHSPAVMPARRPSTPKQQAAWRAGDVVAMQVAGRYHAFYVLQVSHGAPIVEFYDIEQDSPFTWEQLRDVAARGQRLSDGRHFVRRYEMFAMSQQPDPAHQFRLLASGIAPGPDNRHLIPTESLCTATDIFCMARELQAQRQV
ncbi:hypothetical protein [Xanthomonas medicagonis]|uniref:hypothetical protein n=1 Tax=Xanthomonas medicagonis TaxID=3160841 RepID=UPI003514AE38